MPFEFGSLLAQFLQRNRSLRVVVAEGTSIGAAVMCSHGGDKGCLNCFAVCQFYKDSNIVRRLRDKTLRKLASWGIHRFGFRLPDEGNDQSFWTALKWVDRPTWQLIKPDCQAATALAATAFVLSLSDSVPATGCCFSST